ncbi:EAL domain-containing protein [Zooshikella ganghwensis]|uniref:EAL domain-containing protein n=1 Tax=Zooshikella ganghwensis TaxID=202772 RepID=A0A4P9VIE7_9GAMM|nr:EAL domain-containing protein [Zooshikella ganghwensis]RDH42000.1 EAL domain-containing protein [Zooshikella ganghwensis]
MHISGDDFGVGDSSLSQLKRLTLDFLKIGRSFIAGTTKSQDSHAIASMITSLGHNLVLSVLAEEIEYAEY